MQKKNAMFGLMRVKYLPKVGSEKMCMSLKRYVVKTNPTNGHKKSDKKRVLFPLGARNTCLDNGEHASAFYMSKFQNKLEQNNIDDSLVRTAR
ncbi:hypothetical protein IGI04_030424, partial [Brassica rapa subsp. trilocularis]